MINYDAVDIGIESLIPISTMLYFQPSKMKLVYYFYRIPVV